METVDDRQGGGKEARELQKRSYNRQTRLAGWQAVGYEVK
jgi:hypothetical protein